MRGSEWLCASQYRRKSPHCRVAVLFSGIGRRERQVGVAIDEARHHNPACRVDFDRVVHRREVFHAARWPRLAQDASGDENRPVGDYAQVVQTDSATRCSRAAPRQQLFRAAISIFPRWMRNSL